MYSKSLIEASNIVRQSYKLYLSSYICMHACICIRVNGGKFWKPTKQNCELQLLARVATGN